MMDPDGNVIDDTELIGVENGDEIIISNDAEFTPEVLAAIIQAPDTCSGVGFVD